MMIAEKILNLLYPAKCCFCHKLTEGEMVCRKCLDKLPYTGSNACQNCFGNIAACVSPLYYDADVKESILRYKFSSVTSYASVYSDFIAKCVDENHITCDIITWVPLSRIRRWKRGYNQAELIALELAARLQLTSEVLLRKIRNNPAQSGTGNAAKRKANVQGVYKTINDDYIRGKRILLVDDVVTTGATLSECARMLKKAGCREVYAATLARSKV